MSFLFIVFYLFDVLFYIYNAKLAVAVQFQLGVLFDPIYSGDRVLARDTVQDFVSLETANVVELDIVVVLVADRKSENPSRRETSSGTNFILFFDFQKLGLQTIVNLKTILEEAYDLMR